MTLREAEAEVRRMRRWKKKAGPGFRQKADAALREAVKQALIAAAAARFGKGR
jgi:hypothetical protein